MPLPRRGWTVATGRALPVARLRARDGIEFGLLLGIAAGPAGIVEGEHRFDDLSADVPDFFERFERHLNDLAGRFTVLVTSGGDERVYCDPVGMNGVVYNPETWRVASSLKLCLDDEIVDHPLYDHDINETQGGKYSLFHTRDARVRRLNPSCYLDLTNFHESRFWPLDDSFDMPAGGLEAVYDEIITTARHRIGAIVAGHDCAMPLSGGRDSRLLAAFAGPHMAQVQQVFTHVTNYATRIDAEIGKRMAAVLQVPHEVHDRRELRRKPRRVRRSARYFNTAAGSMLRLPDELEQDVNHLLRPGRVVLRAHQTDLLRAFFVARPDPRRWKDFYWQIEKLLIVPRNQMSDAVYQRFLPDFLVWHRTLPRSAMARSVDFVCLELYLPSTQGLTFPGLHRHFYMSPFNCRRLIELSLSIDVAYRKSSAPVDDLLYRMNPDLLALSYDNEFGSDLRDLDGDLPKRDARLADTMARKVNAVALRRRA